jgi:predicted DNA-binding protein
MATKNPRLNVVMEPSLFRSLKKLAQNDGSSLSLKARDLIREALEDYEDEYWAEEAEKREKTFNLKKALSHKKVWGK